MAESAITLAASAARTASGQGSAIDITALGGTCRLALDVTANDSTNTNYSSNPRAQLSVFIETSIDGLGAWRELFSSALNDRDGRRFQPGAGVRNERRVFVGADRFVRARWEIGGASPSVTFSVSGHAI